MPPRSSLLLSVALALAIAVALLAAPAGAVSFAYEVDSATGEDFSGSSLPDGWFVSFGSPSVGGGVLRLGDPGSLVPINVEGTTLTMERTEVHRLVDSGESFFESTWNPTVPGLDEWAGMHFPVSYTPEEEIGSGIFIANFSPSVAAALGAVPGLQMLIWKGHRIGEVWDFSIQSEVIEASEITGQIWMAMSASSSYWQYGFSLDGGNSVRQPWSFTASDVSGMPTHMALGADPIVAVPEPAAALLAPLALVGLAARIRRRRA